MGEAERKLWGEGAGNPVVALLQQQTLQPQTIAREETTLSAPSDHPRGQAWEDRALEKTHIVTKPSDGKVSEGDVRKRDDPGPQKDLPTDQKGKSPSQPNAGESGLQGEPQPGPPGEPQPGLPGEPQPGLPGEPQSGPPVEPQPGPPGEPQSGPPVEPQSGPPVEPQSGLPGETQSGPPVEPQSGPPVEPQPGPPVEPQPDPPGDPQPGPPGEPVTARSVYQKLINERSTERPTQSPPPVPVEEQVKGTEEGVTVEDDLRIEELETATEEIIVQKEEAAETELKQEVESQEVTKHDEEEGGGMDTLNQCGDDL